MIWLAFPILSPGVTFWPTFTINILDESMFSYFFMDCELSGQVETGEKRKMRGCCGISWVASRDSRPIYLFISSALKRTIPWHHFPFLLFHLFSNRNDLFTALASNLCRIRFLSLKNISMTMILHAVIGCYSIRYILSRGDSFFRPVFVFFFVI